MNIRQKQYFYQEGMNVFNYLRRYYPSLHFNRLRFIKGREKSQGLFDFRERNIYMCEEFFDELLETSPQKEVARQFIMVLCHELAHASDDFLKHPNLLEKGKGPRRYTLIHADVEAFATYRESRMVTQLSRYPSTIFGFQWTEEELREIARESINHGFETARSIQRQIESFQTYFQYRFEQFFLRLFHSRTRHSFNYEQDFYKSFKACQSARKTVTLDVMRQKLNA